MQHTLRKQTQDQWSSKMIQECTVSERAEQQRVVNSVRSRHCRLGSPSMPSRSQARTSEAIAQRTRRERTQECVCLNDLHVMHAIQVVH